MYIFEQQQTKILWNFINIPQMPERSYVECWVSFYLASEKVTVLRIQILATHQTSLGNIYDEAFL